MKNQTIEGKIIALAEAFLNEEYAGDYFIVSNDFSADKVVRFYIDGYEPVSFLICRRLSRHLESHLDENLWLGEKYKLEVSSPGADRPLTDPRQFKKHIGRKIKVKEVSGNTSEGKMTNIADGKLYLESKNKKEVQLDIANIEQVKIEISFK